MLYGTERAVQCSALCYSEVRCSAAQHCCMVLCDAVWHHTQLYGTVQCCVGLYRAVWGYTVLCGAVWCCAVLYTVHSATLPTVLHDVVLVLHDAVGCCAVLQDVAQCYTRWYSAVNVQCYTAYSATQCCRAL